MKRDEARERDEGEEVRLKEEQREEWNGKRKEKKKASEGWRGHTLELFDPNKPLSPWHHHAICGPHRVCVSVWDTHTQRRQWQKNQETEGSRYCVFMFWIWLDRKMTEGSSSLKEEIIPITDLKRSALTQPINCESILSLWITQSGLSDSSNRPLELSLRACCWGVAGSAIKSIRWVSYTFKDMGFWLFKNVLG